MHVPGKLYEVTSQTIANSYALRPCEESTALIVGVIGKAQELFPSVRLHATNPLSTHTTDLISATRPCEISDFVGFVKCNIAKELSVLHRLPFGVFAKRRAHIIPIASDRESQEKRLRYLLGQGTKEDLVESPRHWPGVTGVHALETGARLAGFWFDRTEEHREGRPRGTLDNLEFATEYVLKFSPLPSWEGMSVRAQRKRVTEIVDDITREANERRESEGKTVLGAAAVLAFSPHFVPAKVKRSPQPIALAASKQAFKALRKVIVDFCNRFWEASRASRQPKTTEVPGATDATDATDVTGIDFPPFSYPPGRPMTRGDDTDAFTFAILEFDPDVGFA